MTITAWELLSAYSDKLHESWIEWEKINNYWIVEWVRSIIEKWVELQLLSDKEVLDWIRANWDEEFIVEPMTLSDILNEIEIANEDNLIIWNFFALLKSDIEVAIFWEIINLWSEDNWKEAIEKYLRENNSLDKLEDISPLYSFIKLLKSYIAWTKDDINESNNDKEDDDFMEDDWYILFDLMLDVLEAGSIDIYENPVFVEDNEIKEFIIGIKSLIKSYIWSSNSLYVSQENITLH